MSFIEILHAASKLIDKELRFDRIPMPEYRAEIEAWAAYCEDRLYVLKFPDGTFAFQKGASPYDAWHQFMMTSGNADKWLKEQEGK